MIIRAGHISASASQCISGMHGMLADGLGGLRGRVHLEPRVLARIDGLKVIATAHFNTGAQRRVL